MNVLILLLATLVAPQAQEPPPWMKVVEALRPPRFKKDDIRLWPNGQPLDTLCDPGAVALLESAVGKPDALELKTPLDRLLFQRSLWACFDAHVRSWKSIEPGQEKPEKMLGLLSRLLLKTAPAAADLKSVPDPYARTVESKIVPAAFDPKAPGKGFLPADLFQEDGPWVCVGSSTDVPLAAEHVGFLAGRSVFLIFIRAGAARKESLALAERLAGHFAKRGDPIPALPAGTQAILLEQALAVTSEGTIVVSPLVERVEARVNIAPDRVTRGPESVDAQRFSSFRLRSDLLRSGDPAPLRPLTSEKSDEEPTFTIDFGTMGANDRFPRMQKCSACHRRTHAETFGFYGSIRAGAPLLGGPRAFAAVSADDERQRTIRWKQRDVTGTELQALMK